MVRMVVLFSPLLVCTAAAETMRVGVFGGNDNSAWSTSECAKGTVREKVACNIGVYEAGAAAAAQQGVQVLVFPEYGLGGINSRDGFFEAVDDAVVGTTPCDDLSGDEASERPQQQAMSCAARDNSLLLSVNMHTRVSNGDHHITKIAFGPSGSVLAVYHKHHLFPGEGWPVGSIKAGPFAPTSFDALGHRWGLVICWEGIKPIVDGDYSQFDGLVEQGAEAILWSVGDTGGTLAEASHKIAKRYNLPVLSVENRELAGIVDGAYIKEGSGRDAAYTDTALGALTPEGHTGKPYVRHSDIELGFPIGGVAV